MSLTVVGRMGFEIPKGKSPEPVYVENIKELTRVNKDTIIAFVRGDIERIFTRHTNAWNHDVNSEGFVQDANLNLKEDKYRLQELPIVSSFAEIDQRIVIAGNVTIDGHVVLIGKGVIEPKPGKEIIISPRHEISIDDIAGAHMMSDKKGIIRFGEDNEISFSIGPLPGPDEIMEIYRQKSLLRTAKE